MTVSPIHTTIDRVLESLDGELTSHSRVVDALLDVRGTCGDERVIDLVDHALRTMPGKNSAPTEWLHEQVTYVGLMAELTLVAPVVEQQAA